MQGVARLRFRSGKKAAAGDLVGNGSHSPNGWANRSAMTQSGWMKSKTDVGCLHVDIFSPWSSLRGMPAKQPYHPIGYRLRLSERDWPCEKLCALRCVFRGIVSTDFTAS